MIRVCAFLCGFAVATLAGLAGAEAVSLEELEADKTLSTEIQKDLEEREIVFEEIVTIESDSLTIDVDTELGENHGEVDSISPEQIDVYDTEGADEAIEAEAYEVDDTLVDDDAAALTDPEPVADEGVEPETLAATVSDEEAGTELDGALATEEDLAELEEGDVSSPPAEAAAVEQVVDADEADEIDADASAEDDAAEDRDDAADEIEKAAPAAPDKSQLED